MVTPEVMIGIMKEVIVESLVMSDHVLELPNAVLLVVKGDLFLIFFHFFSMALAASCSSLRLL